MNTTPNFQTGNRVYREPDKATGTIGRILKQEDAPLEVIWDANQTSDWFKIDGRMWEEDERPTIYLEGEVSRNKCYIAGKITGLSEAEYKANFQAAKEIVAALGYEPISPLDLPHQHGRTWADYLREDIAALLQCQKLFALNDWTKSRGATIEVDLAIDLGLLVHFQKTDGTVITPHQPQAQ